MDNGFVFRSMDRVTRQVMVYLNLKHSKYGNVTPETQLKWFVKTQFWYFSPKIHIIVLFDVCAVVSYSATR